MAAISYGTYGGYSGEPLTFLRSPSTQSIRVIDNETRRVLDEIPDYERQYQEHPKIAAYNQLRQMKQMGMLDPYTYRDQALAMFDKTHYRYVADRKKGQELSSEEDLQKHSSKADKHRKNLSKVFWAHKRKNEI